MQFTADAWDGIADGSITVTFRTWATPRVRRGHSYRVPPGVVTVDAVSRVRAGDISRDDAAATGGDLGSELGLETLACKRRVRRLEELGLTESPRVGHRLSARGEAIADDLGIGR